MRRRRQGCRRWAALALGALGCLLLLMLLRVPPHPPPTASSSAAASAAFSGRLTTPGTLWRRLRPSPLAAERRRRGGHGRGWMLLRGGAGGGGPDADGGEGSRAFDYDLAVIGGGSGGLACAKEAAKHNAKVILFDYVKPSTQGTTWGLGGTCVNVGCVPKKIMHYAALLGKGFYDASKLGWNFSEPTHDWHTLTESVNTHIRSLNFAYRVGLRSNGVRYVNALAAMKGNRTIAFLTKDGREESIRAKHILISVGGRPRIPDGIPGARELAITSDDIFSLKKHPGRRVLVIGGSYIALETAGFLREFGIDVDVAVRSVVLRGFDRQCAEKIKQHMKDIGVKFLEGYSPLELSKRPQDGKIVVSFNISRHGDSQTAEAEYDTVLFATGRTPDTKSLGLENEDVLKPGPDCNFKLRADDGCNFGLELNPMSSIAEGVIGRTCKFHTWVHAVGDVLADRPELTPVAIRQGEILARRLFKQDGDHGERINYELVPTTVFTPCEYGSVGLSEEDAIQRYGKQDVEVFLSEFTSLEQAPVHRQKAKPESYLDADMPPNALSKLICVKSEGNRVIGFHFVGPNAGEVTQGFALGLALGAKKEDFDKLVGIHPTDAESFCGLSITKSSGESWVAAGGCGGGKCG